MKEESEEKSNNGGLISRIISDLVDVGGGREKESSEMNRGEKELEEITHGGFIDNIVAGHLLPQNCRNETEQVVVPPPPAEKNGENGDGGGGGIIHGIVSHLPAAITNGPSPEVEEASLLIHSIVHE